MYYKKYQLPDLKHDHVDLNVYLDPQEGFECIQTYKIWILLKKLGYKHSYCPAVTRIEDKFLFSFFFIKGVDFTELFTVVLIFIIGIS